MRREERVDRITGAKAARHPPAGGQSVAEQTPLKDAEQRGMDLAVFDALLSPVLRPDLGLLDIAADPKHDDGRQHTDPQHAPPAYVVEEQPVDRARQQKTDPPRALKDPAQ